ncbi:MAG TPA: MFS transporter [Candidatus Hydrogenedentes bacterium]|nr:MFS transporter [Candidatus Hydrogenedentota bacterium]HRT19267.1 MFS transporter [Candidatus Hydrogenedentota bacterium]HRT63347.1 MFS transporter [Candidatus Hydrogenedentota bacterium]
MRFKDTLSYGMGGLSMNFCDMVFLQWLYVRYAPHDQPHLVPPALIGLFILLGRITEAVYGPFVGHWSDGFRSSSGRRLPFIRRGLPCLAAAIFLMWMPPIPHAHWLNALYLFVMIEVYLICYDSVVTPYLSLMPELTSDFRQRVNLTTMQAVFIMLGALLFAGVGFVVHWGGWRVLGVVVAGLTVLFMLPVAVRLRERNAGATPAGDRLGFIEGLRLTLGNRAFLYVVLSTSCYWYGLDSVMKLLPLWTTGYLGRGEDTVSLLMVPFLVMNVAFFFVVNVLAKRHGKYAVMMLTFGATTLAFAMFGVTGLLPLGSPFVQTVFVIAFAGMAIAGFMVLPFAVLSDVIDYDEKLTGRRREAIYFGFQGSFQKLSLGISSLLFGVLAYGPDGAVSVQGLRSVALLAAGISVIGIVIFIGYPLREREGTVVSIRETMRP